MKETGFDRSRREKREKAMSEAENLSYDFASDAEREAKRLIKEFHGADSPRRFEILNVLILAREKARENWYASTKRRDRRWGNLVAPRSSTGKRRFEELQKVMKAYRLYWEIANTLIVSDITNLHRDAAKRQYAAAKV